MNIELINNLIEKVEYEIDNDEYGVHTINGISNLSRSDLEDILCFCKLLLSKKETKNYIKSQEIKNIFSTIGINNF